MRLKTLNDLDMYKSYKKLLKEEGIKWVKYWEKFPQSQSVEMLVNHMQIWGRIAQLKEFFNITEEDLK